MEDVLELGPMEGLGGQRRPVVGEVALLFPLDYEIREIHGAPYRPVAIEQIIRRSALIGLLSRGTAGARG